MKGEEKQQVMSLIKILVNIFLLYTLEISPIGVCLAGEAEVQDVTTPMTAQQ